MKAIDHVSDTNGVELHRLSKLYQFPDFVKVAAIETIQPGRLSPNVYADFPNQQFPCHNKASTYLSALFFREKKAEYHPKKAKPVQDRIDHFVKHWAIKSAVDAMLVRWEETHKNADDKLPDSDFAYVWDGDDGIKKRQCRLKNAAEVKVAAEWLHQYRDQLPFEQRNIIASKILEKAARYGAGLDPHEKFIDQQAGQGIPNPRRIAVMLAGRAKLAKTAEHREAIAKLAATVERQPRLALTPDSLVKLAATVESIDRGIGIRQYTDIIRRPEEVIFEATFKEVQAGLDDSVPMTTGTIYDAEDFGKVALDDVKAMFGAELANEVRSGIDEVDSVKMAEIASTLPRGDAQMFDQLMEASGVRPISVKAASIPESFTDDQFKKWAATYRG